MTMIVNCIHINVRSLHSKTDEIRFITLQANADCLSVNETMLDSSIANSEIDD